MYGATTELVFSDKATKDRRGCTETGDELWEPVNHCPTTLTRFYEIALWQHSLPDIAP